VLLGTFGVIPPAYRLFGFGQLFLFGARVLLLDYRAVWKLSTSSFEFAWVVSELWVYMSESSTLLGVSGVVSTTVTRGPGVLRKGQG
jgi:hypothetical protein